MKRLLACMIWVCFLGACRAGPGSERPEVLKTDDPSIGRAPDRNLLIVTLDTTRADRLGAYGFAGIQTPTLDRLARDGVLYRQATSVAPLTLPAHCSLFTGLNPPRHGVRDNAGRKLDTSRTTLAELVRDRGFRTGAFVASYVLDAERGLDQGFDRYADVLVEKDSATRAPGDLQLPANRVVTRAIDWITHVGASRFFAWVHLYDPHAPYEPPEPYKSIYAGRPYVGEIAFVDAQVGRLITFLESRDLLDRTAVVVLGDHGESLGEHGEAGHGLFVYESVLRVPFIVRAPSIRRAVRDVATVTRTIDVLPTALDLLGLPVPDALDGVSLVPLMTGTVRHLGLDAYAESMSPRYRFGWSALHALRSGRFKLIDAPRPELYDLEADPGETKNLYAPSLHLVKSMTQRLRAAERTESTEMAPAEVDPAAAERLRALGYVGTLAVNAVSDTPAKLADPKDKLALYNRIMRRQWPGKYQ